MKNYSVVWVLLLLLIFGIETARTESDTADYSIPQYYGLYLDPELTIPTGAKNMLTINYLTELGIENTIGSKWFEEKKPLSRGAGAVLRFFKSRFIDLPADYFLPVFSHEFFGHGGRYRELNIENIDYSFETPPPYGSGGGAASTNIDGSTITKHELIAIYIGGYEAQNSINSNLNMRWVAKKKIRYREASMYFWSFQIMYDYMMDTQNFEERADPAQYTKLLNENAGITDLNNPIMSIKGLKNRYRLNLVNPFLLFSIYTQVKTYMYDAELVADMPMIRTKYFEYLPSFRTVLTPFGPAYHLENYLRFESKVALVDLHVGDNAFHKSWGGVGLSILNVIEKPRFSLDMELQSWNQPGLDLKRNETGLFGDGFGGAAALTGHYELSEKEHPLTAILQLGYKSAGYLEGYPLHSAPILSAGLGCRF